MDGLPCLTLSSKVFMGARRVEGITMICCQQRNRLPIIGRIELLLWNRSDCVTRERGRSMSWERYIMSFSTFTVDVDVAFVRMEESV